MDATLHKKFYFLLIPRTLVGGGISIYTIYLLLQLWHSFNSALIISIFYVFVFLIPAIISPFAGTYIDRHSKKRIGELAILLLIFSLIPLFFSNSIYLMFGVFILLLIFEAWFNINYTVAVRIFVGKEKLIYANNMLTFSIGITNLVGYLVGAYLYSYISLHLLSIVIFVIFVASGLIWLLVEIPEKIRRESAKNIKYSEILLYLKSHKNLIYLLLIYDVVVLFTIAIVIPAYIPYSFNLIGMSSVTYGFYSGLSAFLLAIVPLSIHKFIKSQNIKKYAVSSILYEGILTLGIASVPFIFHLRIYKIILFIVLASIMTIPATLEITSFSTIFQKAVSISLLGRFYSVRSLFRGAVNVSGLLIAGFIADLLGPIPVIVSSGLILILMIVPTKYVLSKISN